MRTIALGNSDRPCLIDDEDYERTVVYSWHATRPGRGREYVTAHVPGSGKNGRKVQLHRFLLNAPLGSVVDHISGDTFDNRRGNLRLCSQAENSRNQIKRAGGSSKYKGVSWSRASRKWRATITLNRRQRYLGSFETELEAARAYNEAAANLYGCFAAPNLIEEHP